MSTSGKPCVVRKLLSFVSPISLGLVAIYAVLAGLPRTATAADAIVTDQGPLKGLSVPSENVYVGIPYAAPPVGNLRWRPPQPPARFKGLFQATQFGNPCVQSDGIGETFGSEDCLSLNESVIALSSERGFTQFLAGYSDFVFSDASFSSFAVFAGEIPPSIFDSS
jgi:hypothetical protein